MKSTPRPIVVKRAVNTNDNGGGVSVAYQTYATTFAKITQKKGQRMDEAGVLRFASYLECRIYQRAGLSFLTSDLILYKGKTYGILNISTEEFEGVNEWVLNLSAQ